MMLDVRPIPEKNLTDIPVASPQRCSQSLHDLSLPLLEEGTQGRDRRSLAAGPNPRGGASLQRPGKGQHGRGRKAPLRLN